MGMWWPCRPIPSLTKRTAERRPRRPLDMSSNGKTPDARVQRLDAFAAALPPRGTVLILPHDYPDPDALASAAAMHLLLEKHCHRASQIVFSGMVARAENRVLLRHFRYRWRLLKDFKPTQGKSYPAVFVDARPWSGNTTVPDCATPVAVFDHHKLHGRQGAHDDLYLDVRPKLGATASMLLEYLGAADVSVPTWLAAAMAYAIATETMDFTRPFEQADLKAYVALIGRANLRMLGEIRNAPLPQAYFAGMKTAIARARVYGRTAWSHLPSVDQPEFVAEIADRLVQIERITWSFCTAFHGDRLLVSLRSNRREAACASVLRRAMPRGGESGGHERLAAGALDVTGLSDEQRGALQRQLERKLIRRIERRTAGRGETPAELSRPLVGGD